ncbi:hypothetical protein DFH09DRAFT_1330918 [Mycena vulgaris]|nr:hypothetical protein DFH09DRAFT_1330918 [Mycena vulgaris]
MYICLIFAATPPIKKGRETGNGLAAPNPFNPMFPKLTVTVTSVLTTLVVALPQTPPVTAPTSLQCCSSVVPSSSIVAWAVATLLGLSLTGLNVNVGLSCSHITVIRNNCGATTVICDAPEK